MTPPATVAKWSKSPKTLALPKNEVHVWRAWLDAEPAQYSRLRQHLSEDEIARANRFVFPRDRDHFIVARGTLRELLGAYLQSAPRSLQFTTGKFGKPALADQNNFRFNVTHSHGLALYAFAVEAQVGIDTEKIREDFGGRDIAERYFSKAEQKELLDLPSEVQATAFFLCWTRKEAYIKAHGDGLQIALDSFDVSLTPGMPETLRTSDKQAWSLRSFTPAPQFVAALVVQGTAPDISFWE